MNWIDQVKDRAKIIEVVSRYCPIGNSNKSRSMINCPFHSEKTASLHIDTNRNIFYCFGCKVGGDPIKFIQLIERTTFIDACKLLANIYNIPQNNEPVNRELLALEKIITFCSDELTKNTKVKEYLKFRDVTDTSIDKFNIGWFPDQARFKNFCAKEGVSDNILANIGINSYLFANRIIFPIYSQRNIVGLGGRSLDESRAKYVNTAESVYFKKKEVLFGINHIKSYHDKVLLVEGYLDVCICNQNGIAAVSCLGTTVSTKQIELLWEYTHEIVIVFDGDNAGRIATDKTALSSLELIKPGKIISFLEMLDQEDPASYIVKFKHIDNLVYSSLVDKLWQIYCADLAKNPEVQVKQYHNLLAHANSIKDYDLRKLYIKAWKDRWFSKNSKKQSSIPKVNNVSDIQEIILLALPFYYPDILDYIWDYLSDINFSANLSRIQEILIQDPIDFTHPVMIEFCVKLCTKQKLCEIMPSLRSDSSVDNIVNRWIEVFRYYSEFNITGVR